jgi:hypothetical protein
MEWLAEPRYRRLELERWQIVNKAEGLDWQ